MSYVAFGKWRDAGDDGKNSTTNVFSEDVRRFVSVERWAFAKTMPDWPHEYLVRDRVDRKVFERMVNHIRLNGYEGRFYQKEIRYYQEAGFLYWTLGTPLEETLIINRCRKEDSFDVRSENRSAERGQSEARPQLAGRW